MPDPFSYFHVSNVCAKYKSIKMEAATKSHFSPQDDYFRGLISKAKIFGIYSADSRLKKGHLFMIHYCLSLGVMWVLGKIQVHLPRNTI